MIFKKAGENQLQCYNMQTYYFCFIILITQFSVSFVVLFLGEIIFNCYFTGFVNTYNEQVRYTVPEGRVLRGVVSMYDEGHK